MTNKVDDFARRYANGEFDDAYYKFPLQFDKLDIPTVEWFDKYANLADHGDIYEGYGVDGFHASGHRWEGAPLWYAIIDSYPEFGEWSVEHGGSRLQNWGDTTKVTHERYEEIIAEAFEIFVEIYNRYAPVPLQPSVYQSPYETPEYLARLASAKKQVQ